MRIIYSPSYDIGFFGLEKLHPFDTHKYSRAWKQLNLLLEEAGMTSADHLLVQPEEHMSTDELLAVHTAQYLERLGDAKYLARAIEVPQVERLPVWAVDLFVLRPMRLATRGTILAAEEAIRTGVAVNLSGGYHHAKPDQGEGFCIYADIPLAMHSLRASGKLARGDRVVCVDLDAHQGNGLSHCFLDDRDVFLFDMFNPRIYPAYDRVARDRVDCAVPLPHSCGDADYQELLQSRLPGFLDTVSQSAPVRLAIYNAGTDVYAGDALGGLKVTAEGVLRRDRFVFDEFARRKIPTVMVLSGGYSQESYRMIAATLMSLIQNPLRVESSPPE